MQPQQDKTRREVLQSWAAGAAGVAVSGFVAPTTASADTIDLSSLKRLQIGLVADVHQDIIHDGFARMLYFIDQMNEQKPDIMLQLGDFAIPRKRNQPFLDAWNSFEGPKYHVLGNHDMDHGNPKTDLGFSKEQTMEWWEMPSRYYSFDEHGWHFVVLDGNKIGAPWIGEVARDQQEWLAEDLKKTDAPTLILSHQSLERTRGGVTNGEEVRAILEKANLDAGRKKVFACLSGHHHTDYLREINGIPYIQINSMSYGSGGGRKREDRFPKHIDHANPFLRLVSPYRDPLFTVVTLDPNEGTLTIEGKKTEFLFPATEDQELARADRRSPAITARELDIL